MNSTYKKFIYIVPDIFSDEVSKTDKKALEIKLKCQSALSENKEQVFQDLMEVPSSFFTHLLNHMALKHGTLHTLLNVLTFEKQNAKVLCVPVSVVKEVLISFCESLEDSVETLTLELNSIINQLSTLNTFKEKFMPEVGK